MHRFSETLLKKVQTILSGRYDQSFTLDEIPQLKEPIYEVPSGDNVSLFKSKTIEIEELSKKSLNTRSLSIH